MRPKKPQLIPKRQVEQYVRHYKPYLGLSDWVHRVSIDMSSKGDCVASAIAYPHSLSFHLVFAPRCFAAEQIKDRRLYTLEATILHELMHVALWPLVAGLVSDTDMDTAHRVRELIEDPMVDHLSRTFARYLPRPR